MHDGSVDAVRPNDVSSVVSRFIVTSNIPPRKVQTIKVHTFCTPTTWLCCRSMVSPCGRNDFRQLKVKRKLWVTLKLYEMDVRMCASRGGLSTFVVLWAVTQTCPTTERCRSDNVHAHCKQIRISLFQNLPSLGTAALGESLDRLVINRFCTQEGH